MLLSFCVALGNLLLSLGPASCKRKHAKVLCPLTQRVVGGTRTSGPGLTLAKQSTLLSLFPYLLIGGCLTSLRMAEMAKAAVKTVLGSVR